MYASSFHMHDFFAYDDENLTLLPNGQTIVSFAESFSLFKVKHHVL
jgi:hypothetical protein